MPRAARERRRALLPATTNAEAINGSRVDKLQFGTTNSDGVATKSGGKELRVRLTVEIPATLNTTLELYRALSGELKNEITAKALSEYFDKRRHDVVSRMHEAFGSLTL